jgi:hypothetical protein
VSAGRIFLVRVSRTEEMTVTMTASDHDEAMTLAEHVFAGWTAVEATEDES